MTIIRWLLGAGMTYEEAGRMYAPFNRMAAPDPANREAVADLARAALAGDAPLPVHDQQQRRGERAAVGGGAGAGDRGSTVFLIIKLRVNSSRLELATHPASEEPSGYR